MKSIVFGMLLKKISTGASTIVMKTLEMPWALSGEEIMYRLWS